MGYITLRFGGNGNYLVCRINNNYREAIYLAHEKFEAMNIIGFIIYGIITAVMLIAAATHFFDANRHDERRNKNPE